MREELSRDYYVTECGFLPNVTFCISTGEKFIPLIIISLREERRPKWQMMLHKEQYFNVTNKDGRN
jgi:hypothetical protein